MRILAATPWYAPEGGGLERYAHAVLDRLARAGHDVTALAFTRGDARTERVGSVDVHRVRPLATFSNTPVRARHPFALARLARDADVVVGHGPVPFAAESAALAALARRKPFVFTYHAGALRGGGALTRVAAALNRATLERFSFRRAARIVTVSPLVRDRYLADYALKTDVIPPGVDARAFSPGRGARESSEILFVGPLAAAYRWKGVDVLLDAVALLARRVPHARVRVVGDGDRRGELAARVARDGLPVEFAGRLADAALVDAYRRAGVVALPSTSDAESFGMVLAEANACGAPVVASAVGGVPGFVRDGDNGLLVPPGDAHALAAALEALIAAPDKARAMGERGRERVLAEHDWDALARRTEATYRAALAPFAKR